MECAYYFVDGTWNLPTTLTFVGCVGCGRMCQIGAVSTSRPRSWHTTNSKPTHSQCRNTGCNEHHAQPTKCVCEHTEFCIADNPSVVGKHLKGDDM